MIQKGHIQPYWDSRQIKDLPFMTHPEPFTGLDLTDPQDQERYLGIQVDLHRGLPSFLQSETLERAFYFLTNKTYAISRMTPGSVLPFHQDRYSRYKQMHDLNHASDIWRCIVYLEDRAPGHFIDIQNYPLLDWRAGDWLAWHSDTPHMAGNLGLIDRYVLQITGTAMRSTKS
jgi:hypothetical protein